MTGAPDESQQPPARTAEAAEAEVRRLRNALRTHRRDLMDLRRKLASTERAAALGGLVASLAHELGTPLHSIRGHLQLMIDADGLEPRQVGRLEVVMGEVERLTTLIRRHLEGLRSPVPVPAATNANQVVRRVVGLMEPTCDARAARVAVALDPDLEAPVQCDGHQIEQVVFNLVQNAIDAMPEGGVLTVRTQRTPEGLALSVADNGNGIPAELQDRVFEPFFSTKAEQAGNGLGLSLCREIARNHGGDIRLDSEPTVGTVVTMTLRDLTELATP